MNTIPSISEHIDEKVINKVIQDNFAAIAPSYFTLTSNWFVRAYDHYKDIDKFVLIIYLIHQDLKYFFDLPMDKPWIVRGWWNDPDTVKQNFAKHKSTPLNSSVIRWDRGQLKKVYNEINKHAEVIFYTYPSADNYFNHHWYNVWNEDKGFFRGFPQGDIYSWYKGNVFPNDMEAHKLREDYKICLYNNSGFGEGESDDKLHKIYA